MPQRNWERERERLRAVYAAMTDAELQEVADDADSLTEVAGATLRAEMLQRGMEAPTETNSELGEAEPPAPKPVIVGRCRDLHLATVMNSLLASVGIEGFLADDTVIRLDWLISNALGGIKVWTRGNEAREARELLAAGIPETFEVEGIGPYQQPKCPNCSSLDVSFEELDRKIAHLGLLIGIPIAAVKQRWKLPRLRAHLGRTGRNCGGVNPSRASSPADTIGGLVFVIEFAVYGVCRMEGVAGYRVKPGIKRIAR